MDNSVARRTIATLIVLLVGIAATPAAGEDSDDKGRRLLGDERSDEQCPRHIILSGTPADAKRLTLYGVACFKSENFAQAYTYYFRAYQIAPSDLLRAAMGRSLHELGIYDVAAHYYTTFLKQAEGRGAEKIRRRREQLRKDIETKATKVDLRSFPEHATVSVQLENGGWVKVGETPIRTALEPGTYRLKFDRSGYRHRTVRRRIANSEEPKTLEVDLYHKDALFNATAHETKRAGMITALGSVPFLTAGAIYFGLTHDKFAEAEDYTFRADYVPAEQNRLVEQGHRYQRIAIGLTSVGGAALLTGAALFLHGQTLNPSRKTAKVRGVISPRFLGLTGRF